MAKIIKITPECMDEIRKDFEDALSSAKLSDGKINFTKSFGNIKRDATVYFTELAWLKMQTLIREFDKEVAWHGLAYRGNDSEKDEYFIRDILVYPQEVAAATVNTDQEKYQMWLMNHEDDVFNNIRMQGHSHVNMGVTPSSVDTSLYDRILEQLDDTMFYIFLIYNKRGEKTYKIYDLAKNVLFETSDITVKILDDGTGIEKFLQEAKTMVKDKVYSAPVSVYSGGYGGYGGNYPQVGAYKKPEDVNPPAPATQPTVSTSSKSGRRKGKRKNKGGSTSSGSGFHQYSFGNTASEDDDDWDNPYYCHGYMD